MVNPDPYSDETQIHQIGMSKVARRVLQSRGAKIVLVDVDAINRIAMSEKPRVLQSVRYAIRPPSQGAASNPASESTERATFMIDFRASNHVTPNGGGRSLYAPSPDRQLGQKHLGFIFNNFADQWCQLL